MSSLIYDNIGSTRSAHNNMAVRKIRNSWWVDFRHDHVRIRKKSPENSRAGAAAYEALLRRKLALGEPLTHADGPKTKDNQIQRRAFQRASA